MKEVIVQTRCDYPDCDVRNDTEQSPIWGWAHGKGRKPAPVALDLCEKHVDEVMTRDVICATPSHTVDECMAMMTEKKCRHLPVLRDNQLAGIVSLGDCVKVLLQT